MKTVRDSEKQPAKYLIFYRSNSQISLENIFPDKNKVSGNNTFRNINFTSPSDSSHSSYES